MPSTAARSADIDVQDGHLHWCGDCGNSTISPVVYSCEVDVLHTRTDIDVARGLLPGEWG